MNTDLDALRAELAAIRAEIAPLEARRRAIKAELAARGPAETVRHLEAQFPDYPHAWLEPLVRQGESLEEWARRVGPLAPWKALAVGVGLDAEDWRNSYLAWSGWPYADGQRFQMACFRAADPRILDTKAYAAWCRRQGGAYVTLTESAVSRA